MKCIIVKCDNQLKPKAKSKMCVNCRSSIHRWDKRKPSERLERVRNLNLYTNRMKEV